MTKYCLNKNFIPKDFVIRKKDKEECSNKRATLLLCILSTVLMPVTVKNTYFSFFKGENENNSVKEIYKNNDSNYESFYRWMDIINDDTVGTFNNEDGTIYIDSMDKFYKMLNDTNIKIESMEQYDDEKIKVQVSCVTKE